MYTYKAASVYIHLQSCLAVGSFVLHVLTCNFEQTPTGGLRFFYALKSSGGHGILCSHGMAKHAVLSVLGPLIKSHFYFSIAR